MGLERVCPRAALRRRSRHRGKLLIGRATSQRTILTKVMGQALCIYAVYQSNLYVQCKYCA